MIAYLDYAGLGRLRPNAVAAMREALVEVLPHGSAEIGRIFPARRRVRALFAGLLDCSADEIAIVPNTSTGLHLVADGLDWRPGDEIVVFDRDFPANVHPWRALGLRLRWVPMRDGGYLLEDVEAAIGPATRLVAVSQVNFATGFRIDLDAVCALAHRVGALVSVDAVQGIGALALSLADTPVDFLAAGAHKWLCGPVGTGVFFCRREHLDRLRLPGGWVGYAGANDMLTKGAGHFRYDLAPLPTAARAEGGMYDVLGMVGLAEALAELSEVGIDTVAARVRRLTQRLCAGLLSAGCSIAADTHGESWSGVVGFTHPAVESVALARQLVSDGIHVSHPDGMVRASPHFWTEDAEVDALVAAVAGRTGTSRH